MRYKLTAIITNRTIPGADLIKWYRQRCGKSVEAHSIMKEDLAGGKLPWGVIRSELRMVVDSDPRF
jgi:hypothetical protein